MMRNVRVKLDAKERQLLESLVGKRLVSIISNPLTKHHMVFGNVGLVFENQQIEINNRLTKLYIDGTDEYGVLYVTEHDGSFIPRIRPDDGSIRKINSTVIQIKTVTDTITCLKDNRELYRAEFDVAIVLELEDGMVVIEKDIWFEEFLIIHTSSDALENLNPVNHGWTFNEPYTGAFKREIHLIAFLP